MLALGQTMGNRFIPDGFVIAEVLGVINLAWLGMMIMLSQADVVVPEQFISSHGENIVP